VVASSFLTVTNEYPKECGHEILKIGQPLSHWL